MRTRSASSKTVTLADEARADAELVRQCEEYDRRVQSESRPDPCPACATFSIDPASPYGFCARCSVQRRTEEDDGIVPMGKRKRLVTVNRPARVATRSHPDELAEDDELFEKYLAHVLEDFDPTACPACQGRSQIDPKSPRELCCYCTAELDIEEAARNESEKARKREWWRQHGNAWRVEYKAGKKVPRVPQDLDAEETLIRQG